MPDMIVENLTFKNDCSKGNQICKNECFKHSAAVALLAGSYESIRVRKSENSKAVSSDHPYFSRKTS